MLGSKNDDGKGGPYGRTARSTYRYGKRERCELCREERRCFDRHGMVACQSCHADFMPKRKLF